MSAFYPLTKGWLPLSKAVRKNDRSPHRRRTMSSDIKALAARWAAELWNSDYGKPAFGALLIAFTLMLLAMIWWVSRAHEKAHLDSGWHETQISVDQPEAPATSNVVAKTELADCGDADKLLNGSLNKLLEVGKLPQDQVGELDKTLICLSSVDLSRASTKCHLRELIDQARHNVAQTSDSQNLYRSISNVSRELYNTGCWSGRAKK